MREEKIAGHRLEIYDSIDELPVSRFQKYNKLMLIDTGVGGDLQDINAHISKIHGYLKTDINLAVRELDNLRQNMYMISQEMSPKYLAFMALVKSIDGKVIFDFSEKNLKVTLQKLSSVKKKTLDKLIEGLKKKLTPN